MKHRFAILPERRLILLSYIGATSKEDMKEIAFEIWEHPDYDPFYNGIIDFRRARLTLSPADIKEMAAYFLEHPDASHGKAAILTDNPLETALSLIYANRLASKNSMKIFSTWQSARLFVDSPDLPEPA